MADEPKKKDLVSVSGWLYADVLLVIALIGFGSIFASKTSAPPKPTPTTVRSTTTTTTLAPEERLQLHCREFLIEGLDLTMTEELFRNKVIEETKDAVRARGLDRASSEIGIIFVFGYGDQGVGKALAKKFIDTYFRNSPLAGVEADFGGATVVEHNGKIYALKANNGGGKPEVVIKARLIYSGKQDSECR